MLNKHLIQKKYFIFFLLSIFILSLVTGCSDTTSDPNKPIQQPAQNQEVVKNTEGQNQKGESPKEKTESTNPDKEQQPIEESKESEQIVTGELEVHFIDVGQADSTLIKLPNQQTILIDAGNNEDSSLIVNYLKNEGIKKIDHIIGTHPHEDHIGGLDVAIKTFEIGKVYLPKATHTTKTYEDVLLAIKNKGLKITQAKAGVSLDVGPQVSAVFIAPNKTDYEDINNYSAVLKLTFGDTSFLFTGDAEEQSEFEMLAQSRIQLNADVLKIGHHGSSSSSSKGFLEAVSPKYAVISVGRGNTYGHPHGETINKLSENQIHYFRTDLQGSIVAISDGLEIHFNQKVLAKADIKDNGVITVKSEKQEPVAVETSKDDVEKENGKVQIQSINLDTEVVVLKNNSSQSINLSGWKLVSIKGNQVFSFPAGYSLNPGKTIKIVSGRNAQEGPDILLWTKSYIWNNDGDPGALYDNQGNIISEYK